QKRDIYIKMSTSTKKQPQQQQQQKKRQVTAVDEEKTTAQNDKQTIVQKKQRTAAAVVTTEVPTTTTTTTTTSTKSILKKADTPVASAAKGKKTKATTTDNTTTATPVIEKEYSPLLTIGCYEHSILGYEALLMADHPELGNPDEMEVLLQQVFAYAAHSGCVKAVGTTADGEFLVSSSTDETMRVYRLSKREEFGTLSKHEGWINAIQFFGSSHMLAASRDHTLSVWRVADWECLKTLKGHKDIVNSLSIHPSGKAALSVGKDRRLFLWDLMRGVAANYNKLPKEGLIVQWSPTGNHYSVVYADRVAIYTTDAKELHSFEFKQPVLTMKYYDDDILMVGGEDKLITLLDYKNGKVIKQLEGNSARVKGLEVLRFDSVKKPYVVSISSDGNVVVWNIDTELPVGMAETGARLTCITLCNVEVMDHGDSDDQDSDDDDDESDDMEDGDDNDQQEKNIYDGPKMKVDVEYDRVHKTRSPKVKVVDQDDEVEAEVESKSKKTNNKKPTITERKYVIKPPAPMMPGIPVPRKMLAQRKTTT
ncbi:hypothetical protein SAMD00019534_091140, partial [Acytostelium subglobosum LB1]|uniref:hypothetical protein n=1 Tax=Acytostelium subglobosum LB1 TaxID=1410327 RepID=UPI000644E5CB